MRSGNKSHRGLKICCGVTAILLITIFVVLLVLFLTILKPKDPKIISQPVILEHFHLLVFPFLSLNISLGILVTVNNRNYVYGSFKYQNRTTYVCYHEEIVAEAPIEADTILARREHIISTTVNVLADKLITNPNFHGDFAAGVLNVTSETDLHGKVSLFKLIKMKATSYSTCDISIFLLNNSVISVCKSRVSL
ncbi:Late embryogenesis abundant protein [Fagus crenata]